MKQETKLRNIINELKPIIDKARLTPSQLRYIFKEIRTELGLVMPTTKKPLPRYLTPAEIYGFLETAQNISGKHRLFAELLISTGLRVNEARHVCIEDFKDNNQLFVRKPKFGKERYVVYTNSLLHKIKLFVGNRRGYVFVNEKNKMYCKRTLQYWIERIVKESGMIGIHTHSLRHTYACLMLSKGLRIEELKPLMGHASIKTTEIYGRLELGEVKMKYLQFMGDL